VSVIRKFRLGPDRALAGSWQVPVRTVRRPQEGPRSSRISRVLARVQFADVRSIFLSSNRSTLEGPSTSPYSLYNIGRITACTI
jgi:hypothetical protein